MKNEENYCPWHNRDCIFIDYIDPDKLGYSQICFICGRNIRCNYPYQVRVVEE